MQLVSSEGIILRNQDYLERDRLVTVLTRDNGRLRGIVKGSRKLTSRGVGNFEPFSRGIVYYTDRGHGGLVTIRKCDPLPPYLYLHADYHKFLFAGYFAELLDLIPIEPGGTEPYFVLFAETLEALCEEGPERRLPLLRLRFDLRFLQLLGYLPDWGRCCVCGSALFDSAQSSAVAVSEALHAFDLRRGGVRCPNCALDERHGQRLSAASLVFLENWRRDSLNDAETPTVRPTRRALEELQAVVTRHLVHRLEREPRALAMLPTLDALAGAPESVEGPDLSK